METPISTTRTATGKTIDTSFAGSIPANYDTYLGPIFFEPYAIEVARRIRAIRPSSVLELACGTGRVTKHLLTACAPGGKITATDLSPAMIAEARRMVDPDGKANVEWNAVDASVLPYPDATFDAIVCQFGVMFFPDRVKAYREARRVLKPGGTFLVLSWDSLAVNLLPELVDRLLHEFFPVNTPQFYTIPFGYHDEEMIRGEFSAAGFPDITFERMKLDGTSPSPKDATIGLLEGNPLIGEIQALGPDALPSIRRRLESDIAATFGSGPLVLPLQACIMEARRP